MRYTINPESGCWEWNGFITPDGYGRQKIRLVGSGKLEQLAHRVFYYVHVGRLIPAMEIDHICRNRCCVNPEHLEQVDMEVNRARAITRGSKIANCKQGHPYDEANTAWRKTGRYHQRVCKACAATASRKLRAKRKALR